MVLQRGYSILTSLEFVIYPVRHIKDSVDLDSTASIDLCSGQTPLLRAIGNGHEVVVELLLTGAVYLV